MSILWFELYLTLLFFTFLEITRGNVLFLNNKNLCYVNTVLWKEEILIDYVKQNVEGLDPNNFKSCKILCFHNYYLPAFCNYVIVILNKDP